MVMLYVTEFLFEFKIEFLVEKLFPSPTCKRIRSLCTNKERKEEHINKGIKNELQNNVLNNIFL